MSYDMRVYKLVELFLSEVPEKNTAKTDICWLNTSRTSWRIRSSSCCCRIRQDAHPADGL